MNLRVPSLTRFNFVVFICQEGMQQATHTLFSSFSSPHRDSALLSQLVGELNRPPALCLFSFQQSMICKYLAYIQLLPGCLKLRGKARTWPRASLLLLLFTFSTVNNFVHTLQRFNYFLLSQLRGKVRTSLSRPQTLFLLQEIDISQTTNK